MVSRLTLVFSCQVTGKFLTIFMVKIFNFKKTTTRTLQKKKADLLRQLQTPPDLVRASLVRQFLTCGKTNCRCRRGFKHGPFFYLVQCLGTGRVRKFLLKTPRQRKQASDGIAANQEFQRRLAELSEINTEIMRRDVPQNKTA